MNSQVDYTRDSTNDKLAGAIDQSLMYRSRSGEENRPRGSNGHDNTSPTACINSGSSSEHTSKDLSGYRRDSAPTASSPAFFAPPATPPPQYGFRRNTANAMTAGRRVSHRSSSAPGLEAVSKGYDQESLSAVPEGGQVQSPRFSGTTASDTDADTNEALSRPSREAQRRGNETLDGGFAGSTAPGTLPSSSGPNFKFRQLRKYGGERIFQMNDDEVAAALLGETPPAAAEVDRRTGYRYSPHSAKTRGGSAPSGAETGSSSPQLLSPNVARADSAPPTSVEPTATPLAAAVIAEPRSRRERRSGKEEKKRRHHSSRHTRTSSSGGLRGAGSEASAQPMASPTSAWFVGMAAAQQERFESLQERSSTGHELARWKMLELMRHWMSAQGTRSSVDAAIREVLVDAGLAKVKEAWGGGVSGLRTGPLSSKSSDDGGEKAATASGILTGTAAAPAAAASGTKAASPPTSEPPLDKISPKSQLIAKAANTAASEDAVASPRAQTPPPPRAQAGEAAPDRITAELPAMPSSLPPLADGSACSLDGETLTPPTTQTSVPASPVCAGPVLGSPQSSVSRSRRQGKDMMDSAAATAVCDGERGALAPATHLSMLKEGGTVGKRVDADAGDLPPLTATPEKHMAPKGQDTDGTSPDTAAAPLKTDAGAGKTQIAKPYSESTTPRRSPSERPLRSPRTSGSALRRSRSGNSSLREPAKRQAASYDEIPRFYFPLGCPNTREQTINGPLSKRHENPHLKVVDGVAIAAAMYDGEESGVLSASAGALVGGSGDDAGIPNEARRGPKVAAMSNLHAVEDRQVAHYILREFGRLPPFPKHSSKVRLLGGRVRSSGSHHSNLPFAKQELLYKQQFIQCIQRICSQCFGIPRYFAFIILRLIQWEVNSGVADAAGEGGRLLTRPASSSRMGSSSSLLSHNTNGSSGAGSGTLPSLFHVMPQHLKEFYDTHLRSKDAVRRVFDLLILSSRLPNSPAAAASLAATNAAAVAMAVDGQMDSAAPRSLDAAPLRPYLLPQDFVAYIDVLLTQHPGLAFLRQTPDFQTKYLDTVIYRIYYELDRFDRGNLRYSELAASRLIDAFRQVDAAEDINSVLLFFSYEHFYVLYCRFWELDEDRDMLLAPEDLMRYAPEDVMNPAIVQRVFAGVGRRLRCSVPQRIGYEDFVWFCLSEEDKSSPQAIRYWFRVLDLDGDGVLSVYELREFYDATRNKIAQYVQEGLVTFEDVACQVFDMMRCPEHRGLYLSDLLREPEAAAVALNMLTNVVRFLQFEQRDPFVSHQERLLGGLEQSAWDRFARLEYDRMALETDEES